MAASSQTDVSAFRRSSHAEKTSRKFSQNRSVQSTENSNWFHSNSNAVKRSKGRHTTANERSKSHSNGKRSKESHLSVRKYSHVRHGLKAEEQLDVDCLVSPPNSQEQTNEKKHPHGIELKVDRSSQESHLTANEHSDDAQVKQNGKRGCRKKVSNADGVKRLKQSTSQKDNSWRQNSRSRRLVANARERSRIHILSDAFENLRRAVPSYSQDQKLSKLAILKLATYYISALANLAESDTSARSLKQFADCVAHCTKALQTEGRSRRKHF